MVWAPSYADVIEYGAATRCDTNEKTIELASVVQYNDVFTIVASKLTGVNRLSYGNHIVSCAIGKSNVTVNLVVNPGGNGMCRGAGFVSLISFSVGALNIYKEMPFTFFNFNCPLGTGERMLVSIRATERRDFGPAAIEVRRCTAKEFSIDGIYVDLKCEKEMLELAHNTTPKVDAFGAP